jgi:hypothetical protein
MDKVLELLNEIRSKVDTALGGLNLLSNQMREIESEVSLMRSEVAGVMELGGSVLDAKMAMQKGVSEIRTDLHALQKAQVRTYDMVANHSRQPVNVAHRKAQGS